MRIFDVCVCPENGVKVWIDPNSFFLLSAGDKCTRTIVFGWWSPDSVMTNGPFLILINLINFIGFDCFRSERSIVSRMVHVTHFPVNFPVNCFSVFESYIATITCQSESQLCLTDCRINWNEFVLHGSAILFGYRFACGASHNKSPLPGCFGHGNRFLRIHWRWRAESMIFWFEMFGLAINSFFVLLKEEEKWLCSNIEIYLHLFTFVYQTWPPASFPNEKRTNSTSTSVCGLKLSITCQKT